MDRLVASIVAKIKNGIRKLLALRATPNQIASGFAVGVFIGIFPTFGLGGFAILALSPLWKFNIPAAIAGTLIGNPILAPIWIFLSCLVVRLNPSAIKMPKETFVNILAHYSQVGLKYLLGNTVVSLIVATIAYFCVIGVLTEYAKRRKVADDAAALNEPAKE